MDTQPILENFLIKDVSGIIMSFTYDKCINCKKYMTDKESSFDFHLDLICQECKTGDKYNRCNHCMLFYKIFEGRICVSCEGRCLIFCPDCSNVRMFILL